MTDDRIVQRLEEQLRDAHATNADLRERLNDIEKREQAARAAVAEALMCKRQLESAYAKQKAAEDNAAAAQRKQTDAEREAIRARGELEEMCERFEIVKAEANSLNELNARIERSKHVGDLFAA